MLSKQTGNSLVILLIVAALVASGVILGNKIGKGGQNPSPQPSVEVIDQNPTLALSVENQVKPDDLKPGGRFTVDVAVSSKEAVNLVTTKIQYPKQLLKVDSIHDFNALPLWVNKDDFPEDGFVQLIGAKPSPGLATDGKRIVIAKIDFETKQLVKPEDIITPTEINLYSNATNKPLDRVVAAALQLKQDEKPSEKSSPSQLSAQTTQSPSASPDSMTGSLSFSPAIIFTAPGCTFDVTLNYDAGSSQFAGIDAFYTIDSSKIAPQKIVNAKNPPDSLYAPQLRLVKNILQVSYLTPDTRPYQKTGSLGKITFKTIGEPGISFIKPVFSQTAADLTDSNILYSVDRDLLTQATGTTVIIEKAKCQDAANPASFQVLQK